MSAIARSLLQKHSLRALTQWPKDSLRPDTQLQNVLSKRIESQQAQPNLALDAKQLNALHTLLDNRYKSKVSATYEKPLRYLS